MHDWSECWKKAISKLTASTAARCCSREQRCRRSCQEDDHWTGETVWTAQRLWLGTGNWQGRTTQAVEAVMGQLRKAARDRRKCSAVWARSWRGTQKHLEWWLGENWQDQKGHWMKLHSLPNVKDLIDNMSIRVWGPLPCKHERRRTRLRMITRINWLLPSSERNRGLQGTN